MSVNSGEFSVVQFFKNETWEYVRSNVSADEAFDAFKHYTTSITAQTGLTMRVIITDKDDYTNAEWIFGQGLVYPPKET